MPTEDVLIRADYPGAFAPNELAALASALRRAIPDPAVSIGTYHLHYYGVHRHEVVHLRVRFRFARPEPPAYVSEECMDAVLSWARVVWKRHQQTWAKPLPILVSVVYYDRRKEGDWRSEVLTTVILDVPAGQPKPYDGPVGGRGTGARPESPIWLYGPRKNENQSAR
ncbi:MAG TPA: hypothetical protein VGL78_15730 [Solirubrobacteraceae bacterium]|jgi:hypothetical protein